MFYINLNRQCIDDGRYMHRDTHCINRILKFLFKKNRDVIGEKNKIGIFLTRVCEN